MAKRLIKLCLMAFFASLLMACATMKTNPPMRPDTIAYLEEAQRLFNDGYYKRARNLLLPLACDGNPQAQYAIGYMYYYGYGVPQDTDVGYFWIKRAADSQFVPAQQALLMITQDGSKRAYPSGNH
jgi:TPR repeat protein